MKFTDAAIKQFKEMMEKDQKESIRVFLFRSCCSSMLMIDAEKGKPGDKLIKQDGVNIYVDPEVMTQMPEAEIDVKDGEFKINGAAPQAGGSCCGR